MITLETLKPNKGATKKKKRIGRGQGSGKGGTSTKGHKGDQSRAGYFYKPGFEGGQMPIQRRKPKFGFKNPFRKEYKVFSLERLEWVAERCKSLTINLETLVANSIIKNEKTLVKVIGKDYKLTKSLNVRVHKVSAGARQVIEAAGGNVEIIS